MNTRYLHHFHGMIGVFLATAVSSIAGPFVGSDDFNDGNLSSSLWSAPVTSGQAALTESDGRLSITSAATGGGSASLAFTGTSGTFDSDWTVQAEFTNAVGSLTYSTEIGFELRGGAGSSVNFSLKRSSGDPTSPQLSAVFGPGGSLVEAYGSAGGIGINTLALQLVYTASTGILSLNYDGNFSAPGYNWTTFRAYGLAGAGGNARGDFGLTGSDAFSLTLYANILEDAVPAGVLEIDNFQTTAVPEPATCAALSGFFALALAATRRRFRHSGS
jgi:hypothetical protein